MSNTSSHEPTIVDNKNAGEPSSEQIVELSPRDIETREADRLAKKIEEQNTTNKLRASRRKISKKQRDDSYNRTIKQVQDE